MNAVYAFFLSLLFLLTGGYRQYADIGKGSNGVANHHFRTAQHDVHADKQARYKAVDSRILSPELEASFLSDNSDLSDDGQTSFLRVAVLCAFNLFVVCVSSRIKRPLPLCSYLSGIGTSKYLMYRSFRIWDLNFFPNRWYVKHTYSISKTSFISWKEHSCFRACQPCCTW